MRMPTKLLACGLVSAMLVGLGCGGDAATQTTPSDMVFTLAFAAPAVIGQNRLKIDLTDKLGQPLSGATLTVDAQMPHHGHGSTETAVVTDEGNGKYEAFPVTLQMPGMWEISVVAEHGGATSSSTMKLTVP